MDCPRERDTTPSVFRESRHLSRHMTRSRQPACEAGFRLPFLFSLFRQLKFAPMKFKRGAAMGQQVGHIVAAGVEVEFVGNLE